MVIPGFCSVWAGYEVYKVLKRECYAIVLFFRSFVSLAVAVVVFLKFLVVFRSGL